ncbi:hypothetical protein EUX98_g8060 [Antrodiella citrinella]|uniref:Cytochrome P450 n=1 Tax=Antrodiella citrinella TaxID=2447956 RepID=A0A4S4MCU3_9APHY|nr:hypothetical protein EUX98_g8060 [Antrodiella citrinella]
MGATGMPKGPMWLGRTLEPPILPLIAQQDTAEHLRRRKPWNRAFNTAALKGYEPVVAERVSQFVHVLKSQTGVVDLTQWINAYSFDVMSDMAFGGGTDLLRKGDVDKLRWFMDSTMRFTMVLEVLPWLRGIAALIPYITRDIVRFRKMCIQRATRRLQSGSTTKDLFHYLNNEDGVDTVSRPLSHVASDAVLAVVAGSDTTSVVLSNALFYVLNDREVYAKLKAEVDLYYPPGENACDTKHYGKMVYLDAVLNEAMRMYPPNLSGSQRAPMRGSGGKLVGPYFIPEGTSVRIHTFSLARDPRYFSPLADTFWPERWLLAESDSEKNADFVHDIAAFVPFSFGTANCVGKNLAMLEMRMLLCCCIQQLDLALAGDLVGDPGRWERELKDYFIVEKGRLPVTVKARGKA